MDDVLAAIHGWMVGISLTLARHHPDNPDVFLAGPYMLEVSAAQWVGWKIYLLFRSAGRSHTTAYVDESIGLFQAPNGKWHRRTTDKYGKEVGTELTDPPGKPPVAFERQPEGFFKRQS